MLSIRDILSKNISIIANVRISYIIRLFYLEIRKSLPNYYFLQTKYKRIIVIRLFLIKFDRYPSKIYFFTVLLF